MSSLTKKYYRLDVASSREHVDTLEFVSLIQIQHIFLFRSVELHLLKLNAELFMNDQYDLVSSLSNFR